MSLKISKICKSLFKKKYSQKCLAPGQMKTQKEALALKVKIDELRSMQDDASRKGREADMRREGIPLNRDEEV